MRRPHRLTVNRRELTRAVQPQRLPVSSALHDLARVGRWPLEQVGQVAPERTRLAAREHDPVPLAAVFHAGDPVARLRGQ